MYIFRLILVDVNQKFRILAIYRTILLIFPSNAARQIESGIKVTDVVVRKI